MNNLKRVADTELRHATLAAAWKAAHDLDAAKPGRSRSLTGLVDWPPKSVSDRVSFHPRRPSAAGH
jgi:hypothetical protein